MDRLQLRDSYGRIARDLRVSLTDRCNLRCTYCMPAEGLEWTPTEQMLSDEEVNRLVRIAVELLGIRKLRFTGGEPLLRSSLENIIAATAKLRTYRGEKPGIAITSNGLGLDKRISALKAAGLDRVNISLDSVDPQVYHRLSRRDRLADVIRSLRACRDAGIDPIKVNAVAMRDENLAGARDLLRFCLQNGYQLRFIEHMPLGPRHTWQIGQMATAADILENLSTEFELTECPRTTAAPAQLWQVKASAEAPAGTVGIIASVTRPFCATCDRTRLTADGALRNCLFARTETSLREPLRAGASDLEIAEIWADSHRQKAAGHGINDPEFLQPDRLMAAIGG